MISFENNVLHNFISPVTGRVLSDRDYVLIGNLSGIAVPSPALIDLRLDFIDLRFEYNTLVTGSFVIGFPNAQLPNAQVLSTMNPSIGVMTANAGIVKIVPVEDLDVAPVDATYILQTSNHKLPNAQALRDLTLLGLKSDLMYLKSNGSIRLAVGGTGGDYVNSSQFEQAVENLYQYIGQVQSVIDIVQKEADDAREWIDELTSDILALGIKILSNADDVKNDALELTSIEFKRSHMANYKYITQKSSDISYLPQAQALDALEGLPGILYSDTSGVISVTSADVVIKDYVDSAINNAIQVLRKDLIG